MDLNLCIAKVAGGDEAALKEIYERYKTPFYFISLSMLQNETAARRIAAEAFRRIRRCAYRFDEDLNAEYWIADVLYTLCFNKISASGTKRRENGVPGLPELLRKAPEVFLGAYTSLGNNEISALLNQKKSRISAVLKEESPHYEELKRAAEERTPDYWELILPEASTGEETVAHDIRRQSETQKNTVKRKSRYKRILAIVMAAVFMVSVVLMVLQLVRKNYSGDVDSDGTGTEIPFQFKNHIAVTEMDGTVYFRGINNALYSRKMDGGKNEKLSDDYPMELLNDGAYIYYRNNYDGYLYRINPDGTGRLRLCDVPGSAMEIYDKHLYFSAAGGIYRIPKEGAAFEAAELLIDTSHDDNLFCVDLELDEHGNAFFASGVGKGIHFISEYNGEPSLDGIFTEEVYHIQIDRDKLYFDYKDVSGTILLYCFDLQAYFSGESEKRVVPQVVSAADGKKLVLTTGAFYVKDGQIYYAGVENQKKTILTLDLNETEPKIKEAGFAAESAEKKLFITDLYLSEEWLYCYCSDGKAQGKRIFFAGNLNKNETVTIYEG